MERRLDERRRPTSIHDSAQVREIRSVKSLYKEQQGIFNFRTSYSGQNNDSGFVIGTLEPSFDLFFKNVSDSAKTRQQNTTNSIQLDLNHKFYNQRISFLISLE